MKKHTLKTAFVLALAVLLFASPLIAGAEAKKKPASQARPAGGAPRGQGQRKPSFLSGSGIRRILPTVCVKEVGDLISLYITKI